MSLVTNTSQSSANVAVRLAKLQNLYQVLTQGKADKHISKAFSNLKKIDQKGIREKIHGKEIGSSISKQKRTLISVVKGHIRTLAQRKAIRAYQMSVGKSGIATNPFSTVPAPVQTTVTGSFCALKDLANFRASFKDAAKIESASHIIKTYHLDHLIETYLYCSCSDLNESGKVKALHELMSLAYRLSEVEQLPNPNYAVLPAFFQEVEARNLIRMMRAIHEIYVFPDLPESARDLRFSKDSMVTMQKAEHLRTWIHQHQDYLATINGKLNLYKCDLSLLSKEIGKFQALQGLYLSNNCLVSVPKEIGQLKALKELSLSNNLLVRLPKEVGKLQVMQVLWVGYNRLVSLPEEVGQLQELKILYLHDNRLVNVPKEVGQLHGLKVLYLHNNHLASLHKEIGQLQTLVALDLENNGLISLPIELDRFKSAFQKQNKQLQLKTILQQLLLCITGQHNTAKIADLFITTEKLLGKEARRLIHRCLYEVAQEAAKTDKALRKKLKDKHFARNAFLDENFNPKLKAAAIAKFRKNLEKQASVKK